MIASRFTFPALLLAVVVLTYGNSLQGGFHYDDIHSIVANPHIRGLDDIAGFFTHLDRFSADPQKGMYRPLLLVSYAVDYAWSEYSTFVFHSTNLLLHLSCCLLVWSILLKGGSSPCTALVGGLLFALHPLATEPVNYISSRSESLAACLFLGAFRLRLHGSARAEWLAAASFGMGLFTKSVVIVFPAILFLHGISIEAGSWARLFRRDLKFWVLASGYLLLISKIGFLGGSLDHPVRAFDVQLWTQIKALAKYAELVVMPVALNVEHQFFESRIPLEGAVLASFLFVLSTVLLAGRLFNRETLFWYLWIFVCLAPTSFVPLNVLVNEHRLYLPMVGFAALFARLFEQMAPPAKPILYLLFPALSVLALQRNNAWSDEISLWSAAAKKSPLMPRVHVELGNALRVDGRLEAARLRYRRALELDAGHRAARTNLANIYYEEGLRAADETVAREYLLAAAKEYHQVLVSDPGYREALNSLGNVYAEAGNHAAAISYYGKTIELYPNFPEGHYNLARSLGALGRFDEALEMYRRSLALTPDDAEAHFQMGNLRVRLGDLEGGQRAYREAVDLREEVPYLYSLAEVLMAAGQGADSRAGAGALLVEAHGLYKRIERVSPDYRRVRDRLAQLGQYLHE